MFNEKESEFSSKRGEEIPVWKSPKYEEAKKKAIELIDSKKYNLVEGDFWILMNETKSGKMMYTGLIISHNGCLKINDSLEESLKFKPSCVNLDKEGFDGSLVYTYINDEQGIYEVGEVNHNNCKNAYPYAMALKRCMDRVILKNCKLAYSGVYSDSEAEEFKQPQEEQQEELSKKITKEQADVLLKVFENLNLAEEDVAKSLANMGVSTVQDLNNEQYANILRKLKQKQG
jgi:hypothetical protein